MLHFISCMRMTLIVSPVFSKTPTPTAVYTLIHTVLNGWGIFPWLYFIGFGLALAKYAYNPRNQGFLSDSTAVLLGNKRDDAISLQINYVARAYLLALVVLCAIAVWLSVLCLCQLLGVSLLSGYNAAAFLASTLLMLPISLHAPRKWLAQFYHAKAPPAFALCFFLLLLVGYAVALCAIYPLLVTHTQASPIALSPLALPGSWQQQWLIFFGLYACAWGPLAAAVVAYTSIGLSLRHAMGIQLILPIIWATTSSHWLPWLSSTSLPLWVDWLMAMVSLVVMLRLFYHKQALTSLMRTKVYGRTTKDRDTQMLTRNILYGVCIFLSIYSFTGIQIMSFAMPILLLQPYYYGHYASLSLLLSRPFRW